MKTKTKDYTTKDGLNISTRALEIQQAIALDIVLEEVDVLLDELGSIEKMGDIIEARKKQKVLPSS